jgi:hypothetical protein
MLWRWDKFFQTRRSKLSWLKHTYNSVLIDNSKTTIHAVTQFNTSTRQIETNRSGGRGGGIYNQPTTWGIGTASLTNTSMVDDVSDLGVGHEINNNAGAISTINCIIASDRGDANFGGDAITSFGHNISSDDSCDLSVYGDLQNTDPRLGPLQDNGGPTLTHVLLRGSPAIDSGDDILCPEIDQRGIPRPQWHGCDIGAFEYDGTLLPRLLYLPLTASWPSR